MSDLPLKASGSAARWWRAIRHLAFFFSQILPEFFSNSPFPAAGMAGKQQPRMRIDLLSTQPDGSVNWIEVRDAIKGGDIFAVHEANQVDLGEDGRPTRISFQKADDDALIALAQRVITGWSFQVPLPGSFAAAKGVLSDLEGPDLKKFRAEMKPLLDLVRNDDAPDSKSSDLPADAVPDRPAPSPA
jgi:hypothetical protein